MNILTGIVLLIFLLFMIRGYRRGLIKSLASVISLAASVVLVSFVTPYVSQFLQEQTPVYTYVMEKCQESFTVSLDEKTEKLAETEEKTEEEEISLKSRTMTGVWQKRSRANQTDRCRKKQSMNCQSQIC